MAATVRQELLDFIKTGFDSESQEINFDTDLIQSGIVDSFKVLEFIAFIEESYSVELNLEEMNIEKFKSIDSIYDLVQQKSS